MNSPIPRLLGRYRAGRLIPHEWIGACIEPGVTAFAPEPIRAGALCVAEWGSYVMPSGETRWGWVAHSIESEPSTIRVVGDGHVEIISREEPHDSSPA